MRDLPRKLTIDELAALFEGRTQFVERLAAYENPLAEARRLLQSLTEAEQVEALNAHPAIGALRLSASSAREQGSDTDPAVLEALARLNRVYEEKFGFRFVVFVNRRPKAKILEVLRERIGRTRKEELATAVDELVSIAEERYRATGLRMPALQTERLLVRPFTMEDLAACHQILDVELEFEAQAFEARKRWLQWTILNYDELAALRQPPYGDRAVVLKRTTQLIGVCGLVPCLAPFGLLPSFHAPHTSPVESLFSPEVGLFYASSRMHWGRGYATEAARALVAFAFTRLHLKRIVAMTVHANARSIRVMQRLGMRIERNPYPEPSWLQVVGILENATT